LLRGLWGKVSASFGLFPEPLLPIRGKSLKDVSCLFTTRGSGSFSLGASVTGLAAGVVLAGPPPVEQEGTRGEEKRQEKILIL